MIGQRLAELTGAQLLLVEGGGHGLPAREPVLVNREIRAFVERVSPVLPGTVLPGTVLPGTVLPGTVRLAPAEAEAPRTWTRSLRRPKRALYLSSPIGLGHARRDLAIADELRRQRPDLQIDWLTQDPVTRIPRPATSPVRVRTSRTSAPTTTCLCSRRCGAWTRSW
jgi:hypothetical protein